MRHNVAGNSKRDGLKSIVIGKSAAKPPSNRWKVQRLGYGVRKDGKIPRVRDIFKRLKD